MPASDASAIGHAARSLAPHRTGADDAAAPPALGKPMRGRLVRVGRGFVHCLQTGAGEPVLLLHGLGSLGEEMLSVFAAAPSPVRCIAVDRPGYGWSTPLPRKSAGADGQALWLADVMDALALERAFVVAHSIGASAALALAARSPERVRGLLLIAPYCRPSRPGFVPLIRAAAMPVVGPLSRRLIRAAAGRFGAGRLAAAFRPNRMPARLERFPFRHATRPTALLAMAHELRAFNAAMIPLCFRMRRIAAPTVILAGDRDPVADSERHAAWLASRIRDADLVRLSGVGHMPHQVAGLTMRLALARLMARAGAPQS